MRRRQDEKKENKKEVGCCSAIQKKFLLITTHAESLRRCPKNFGVIRATKGEMGGGGKASKAAEMRAGRMCGTGDGPERFDGEVVGEAGDGVFLHRFNLLLVLLVLVGPELLCDECAHEVRLAAASADVLDQPQAVPVHLRDALVHRGGEKEGGKQGKEEMAEEG